MGDGKFDGFAQVLDGGRFCDAGFLAEREGFFSGLFEEFVEIGMVC